MGRAPVVPDLDGYLLLGGTPTFLLFGTGKDQQRCQNRQQEPFCNFHIILLKNSLKSMVAW
jgi:hypothetical protein